MFSAQNFAMASFFQSVVPSIASFAVISDATLIFQQMGFKQTEGKGYPMLRSHYEKILFPFDVFRSGAMTGETLVSTC